MRLDEKSPCQISFCIFPETHQLLFQKVTYIFMCIIFYHKACCQEPASVARAAFFIKSFSAAVSSSDTSLFVFEGSLIILDGKSVERYVITLAKFSEGLLVNERPFRAYTGCFMFEIKGISKVKVAPERIDKW